jgi:hypothetical protein
MDTVTLPRPEVKPARPARKPRPKPARSIKLLAKPGDGASRGCVEITVGKLTTTYHLERIPSDWGVAFELTKFLADGGEVYHVNLDPFAEGGLRMSCDCLGHLQHARCKHAEGLLALCQAGKL